MRKIISLYQRNYEGDRLVRDEVVDGAEWVINGEGVATVKYDGTCCMVKGGALWKRREIKANQTAPEGFIAANDPDPITGKQQGWMPVTDSSEDMHHLEAWNNAGGFLPDGTYELMGPSIQGNPDGYGMHTLVSHDNAENLPTFPRNFEGIKNILEHASIEGVVWHHPDGRMVKIKRKDFFKHKK